MSLVDSCSRSCTLSSLTASWSLSSLSSSSCWPKRSPSSLVTCCSFCSCSVSSSLSLLSLTKTSCISSSCRLSSLFWLRARLAATLSLWIVSSRRLLST
uniref:Uncharacterized protein n=1 Tax=Ixodes ricinus TaxID=34613 RepID=A0A6B0UG79_IXORI